MGTGVFRRFDHDHWFASRADVTVARDRFDFTSPLGVLGRLADRLLVERHLRNFLVHRIHTIRELAESQAWRQFVPE